MHNPFNVGEERFGTTVDFVFDIFLQPGKVHGINNVLAIMRKFFGVNRPPKVMRLQKIH